MRQSRVKAKLKRNEPALITTLHLTDPSLFELTSLMGFDGIWMDMEHHPYSVETGGSLMRAARIGVTDIIARPGKGEYMRMLRMLEAGAQGIMYPRCDGPEEAAEVVRWAKFAPQGLRGFDGGNADMPYCTMPIDRYIREANDETFVIIQIESQEALERADEIAAIDGVDVLMLGPADFSILSGIPGQFDHRLISEARQKIAAAAKKHGKHWGCPSPSVEMTKQLLDMGARFICHMADIVLVKMGLEKIQKDFAPLGFTFENRLNG